MGVRLFGSPPNKKFYKKWAKGSTLTNGSGQIVVTSLGFIPTLVFGYITTQDATYDGFIFIANKNTVIPYAAATTSDFVYGKAKTTAGLDSNGHTWGASNFTFALAAVGYTFTWFAFE